MNQTTEFDLQTCGCGPALAPAANRFGQRGVRGLVVGTSGAVCFERYLARDTEVTR